MGINIDCIIMVLLLAMLRVVVKEKLQKNRKTEIMRAIEQIWDAYAALFEIKAVEEDYERI